MSDESKEMLLYTDYDKAKQNMEELMKESLQTMPKLRKIGNINNKFIPKLIAFMADEVLLPILKPIFDKNSSLQSDINAVSNHNKTQTEAITKIKQIVSKKLDGIEKRLIPNASLNAKQFTDDLLLKIKKEIKAQTFAIRRLQDDQYSRLLGQVNDGKFTNRSIAIKLILHSLEKHNILTVTLFNVSKYFVNFVNLLQKIDIINGNYQMSKGIENSNINIIMELKRTNGLKVKYFHVFEKLFPGSGNDGFNLQTVETFIKSRKSKFLYGIQYYNKYKEYRLIVFDQNIFELTNNNSDIEWTNSRWKNKKCFDLIGLFATNICIPWIQQNSQLIKGKNNIVKLSNNTLVLPNSLRKESNGNGNNNNNNNENNGNENNNNNNRYRSGYGFRNNNIGRHRARGRTHSMHERDRDRSRGRNYGRDPFRPQR